MPFVIVGDDEEGRPQPVTDERGRPKTYKTRAEAEKALPAVQERHLRFVPPSMRDQMPPMRIEEAGPGKHWYFG